MPVHNPSLFAKTLSAVGLIALLSTSGAAAEDAPKKVSIAVISTFASGKVNLTGADYAVEKEGWLRQELAKKGYQLEWYPVANASVGPLTNEAFTNHVIQFAGYSDLPSIILNAAGAGVRTEVVVPGAAPGDAYLVVPANSTAKSIEDLKGKRLAIHKGRPWELTLLHYLDSKGLSYNDFQIYNINLDAGTTAVATGAVDALFTLSPYQLEERKVAKIIWSSLFQPAFLRHYQQAIAYSLDKQLISNAVKAEDLIDDHLVAKAISDLKLDGYWATPGQVAQKSN